MRGTQDDELRLLNTDLINRMANLENKMHQLESKFTELSKQKTNRNEVSGRILEGRDLARSFYRISSSADTSDIDEPNLHPRRLRENTANNNRNSNRIDNPHYMLSRNPNNILYPGAEPVETQRPSNSRINDLRASYEDYRNSRFAGNITLIIIFKVEKLISSFNEIPRFKILYYDEIILNIFVARLLRFGEFIFFRISI